MHVVYGAVLRILTETPGTRRLKLVASADRMPQPCAAAHTRICLGYCGCILHTAPVTIRMSRHARAVAAGGAARGARASRAQGPPPPLFCVVWQTSSNSTRWPCAQRQAWRRVSAPTDDSTKPNYWELRARHRVQPRSHLAPGPAPPPRIAASEPGPRVLLFLWPVEPQVKLRNEARVQERQRLKVRQPQPRAATRG